MANTYLTKTFSTNGTSDKIATISLWCKRAVTDNENSIITGGASSRDLVRFETSGAFRVRLSGGVADLITNRLFRDTSAWYHIVSAIDTTQSTSTDRIKVYVNGVQETSFSTTTYPSLNQTLKLGTAFANHIGNDSEQTNPYFSGIMSHFHFCDGLQLAPTVFGETDATTGEWKINTAPSFTLGTNGFTILKDGNTITDQSTNSNDFTLGGGTLTNTEDCPSDVFATANSLIPNGNIDYSNGNTNSYHTYSGQWRSTISTLGASSGKYYAEFKSSAIGSETSIGICDVETITQTSANDFIGKFIDSVGYANAGSIYKENSVAQGSLATYTTNDIIGVAMDLDNNTVQFYKNGSAIGSTVALTADKTYAFGVGGYGDARILWNFGNGYFGTTAISSAGTNASGIGKFEYDVPTGYTALSTKGLNA